MVKLLFLLNFVYNRTMETLNKPLLKRYLQVFDTIEIKTMDAAEMAEALIFECRKHDIKIESEIVQLLMVNLFESENLLQLEEGIELSQSISIFSRSKEQSITEALAILESCMQKKNVRLFVANHLYSSFSLKDLKKMVTPIFYACLKQSQCLIIQNNQAQFHPILQTDLDWILHQKDSVCSDCLKAHYTKDLYASRMMEYRNLEQPMIEYRNKKES